MSPDAIRAIEAVRETEKRQALFYRALGALAEAADELELAERFHELHADEQHHLSRLTARLVELGATPADLSSLRPERAALEGWEVATREREAAEVERYEGLLDRPDLDDLTRSLLADTLEVERKHLEDLGGKWTLA